MIRDTLDSLRVTLSERIGNPFVSATMLAAVTVNWRLTLLLFADVDYATKVALIESLYPDGHTCLMQFLVIPSAVGLFWLVAWPWLNLGFTKYWYSLQAIIHNAKQVAERKRTLTHAQAAEIYAKIDEQSSRYLEIQRDSSEKLQEAAKSLRDADQRHLDAIDSIVKESASARSELKVATEKASTLRTEKDSFQQQLMAKNDAHRELERRLSAIDTEANLFARWLPGLKTMARLIDGTNNYQADEDWLLREAVKKIEGLPIDDCKVMLRFFLVTGLLRREDGGKITFGDQTKQQRGVIFDVNSNSPSLLPRL